MEKRTECICRQVDIDQCAALQAVVTWQGDGKEGVRRERLSEEAVPLWQGSGGVPPI